MKKTALSIFLLSQAAAYADPAIFFHFGSGGSAETSGLQLQVQNLSVEYITNLSADQLNMLPSGTLSLTTGNLLKVTPQTSGGFITLADLTYSHTGSFATLTGLAFSGPTQLNALPIFEGSLREAASLSFLPSSPCLVDAICTGTFGLNAQILVPIGQLHSQVNSILGHTNQTFASAGILTAQFDGTLNTQNGDVTATSGGLGAFSLSPVATVPEPSTMLSLGSAAVLAVFLRRRKNH